MKELIHFSSLAVLGDASFWTPLIAVLVPGIISIITVVLLNRATSKDRAVEKGADLYKTELNDIIEQRKLTMQENSMLREALKEELEDCREIRKLMEETVGELRIKVNGMEEELHSWKNGRKSPEGFILVRVPKETLPPPHD